MPKYSKGAASILLSAALLIGGCSGGAVVAEPVYPTAPIDYPLYDLSNVDNEQEWHVSNAHDPSIIKVGDTYYVFSTDIKAAGTPRPGIMVRKSKDLIQWDWVGYALKGGIPLAASSWTKATNLWAPDIAKLGEKYYLYYSASEFGTNRSIIGVATSSSIEGPWTDEGEVVRTQQSDAPNAIDPNIAIDADGRPWMAYGSFFGGIYVAPLDPATGKFKDEGFGKQIASRSHQTEEGALEGPYIIYEPKFKKYYLFVSYDSLFADYNVRVGRSDSIEGPYVDRNGHEMNDSSYEPQYEIGNKVLGDYSFSEGDGWVAPGHNSILQDGDRSFMIHHARGQSKTSWAYLHVRQMIWTEDGWPVVSPERYAGETIQAIPESSIPGEWERIYQAKDVNGRVQGKPLSLSWDGAAEGEPGTGKWKLKGEHTLEVTWSLDNGETTVEALELLPSWDWELRKPALVFTGISSDGTGVWGKKLDSGK
ncbi:arabinan endo-1,5-alpha-L-arabinosidase [Cohnella mopanensis]|uniref:arabinan endo-1,5-alpha-L-arabinosidase n=1 Tax=Cohnella mopanensis TaxID=2911966 RepID=UPI001EF9345C|nr:arabinan endo-1,5-alpha-L-arabinosidase [Cohnella mopanensis]